MCDCLPEAEEEVLVFGCLVQFYNDVEVRHDGPLLGPFGELSMVSDCLRGDGRLVAELNLDAWRLKQGDKSEWRHYRIVPTYRPTESLN